MLEKTKAPSMLEAPGWLHLHRRSLSAFVNAFGTCGNKIDTSLPFHMLCLHLPLQYDTVDTIASPANDPTVLDISYFLLCCLCLSWLLFFYCIGILVSSHRRGTKKKSEEDRRQIDVQIAKMGMLNE